MIIQKYEQYEQYEQLLIVMCKLEQTCYIIDHQFLLAFSYLANQPTKITASQDGSYVADFTL